eukprot:Rhum_TRINITY_DN12043_c0_g1::Rhum_TRINITY_DN12043_c0_g1_i1::g.48541::m.48541
MAPVRDVSSFLRVRKSWQHKKAEGGRGEGETLLPLRRHSALMIRTRWHETAHRPSQRPSADERRSGRDRNACKGPTQKVRVPLLRRHRVDAPAFLGHARMQVGVREQNSVVKGVLGAVLDGTHVRALSRPVVCARSRQALRGGELRRHRACDRCLTAGVLVQIACFRDGVGRHRLRRRRCRSSDGRHRPQELRDRGGHAGVMRHECGGCPHHALCPRLPLLCLDFERRQPLHRLHETCPLLGLHVLCPCFARPVAFADQPRPVWHRVVTPCQSLARVRGLLPFKAHGDVRDRLGAAHLSRRYHHCLDVAVYHVADDAERGVAAAAQLRLLRLFRPRVPVDHHVLRADAALLQKRAEHLLCPREEERPAFVSEEHTEERRQARVRLLHDLRRQRRRRRCRFEHRRRMVSLCLPSPCLRLHLDGCQRQVKHLRDEALSFIRLHVLGPRFARPVDFADQPRPVLHGSPPPRQGQEGVGGLLPADAQGDVRDALGAAHGARRHHHRLHVLVRHVSYDTQRGVLPEPGLGVGRVPADHHVLCADAAVFQGRTDRRLGPREEERP